MEKKICYTSTCVEYLLGLIIPLQATVNYKAVLDTVIKRHADLFLYNEKKSHDVVHRIPPLDE